MKKVLIIILVLSLAIVPLLFVSVNTNAWTNVDDSIVVSGDNEYLDSFVFSTSNITGDFSSTATLFTIEAYIDENDTSPITLTVNLSYLGGNYIRFVYNTSNPYISHAISSNEVFTVDTVDDSTYNVSNPTTWNLFRIISVGSVPSSSYNWLSVEAKLLPVDIGDSIGDVISGTFDLGTSILSALVSFFNVLFFTDGELSWLSVFCFAMLGLALTIGMTRWISALIRRKI